MSGSKFYQTPSDVQKIKFVSDEDFCHQLVQRLTKLPDHKTHILSNEERCTVYCKYPDPENINDLRVKGVCQYINAIYSVLAENQTTIQSSGAKANVVNKFAVSDNLPDILPQTASEVSRLGNVTDTLNQSSPNHKEPNPNTNEQIKDTSKANPASPPIIKGPTPSKVGSPAVLISAPVPETATAKVASNNAVGPESIPAIEAPAKAIPVQPIAPKDTEKLPEEQLISDDTYDQETKHIEETADDDDVGEDDNDLKSETDQHPGDTVVRKSTVKHTIKDPFVVDEESSFFFYFMFVLVLIVAAYVLYHNRRFVLAIILEGRRRGGSNDSRRKHTAAYRKLDSNLEEAIASPKNGTTRSQHVIY